MAALCHLGWMPRWKRGCPWENLNSTRDACFKNKSIPFCRAALEAVIKVKSGPAEAGGEVPMDFGLVQIPPLDLTAVQPLPEPEPGLLPYTEFPSAAMEWGLGCISPIKQTELYDARVFES